MDIVVNMSFKSFKNILQFSPTNYVGKVYESRTLLYFLCFYIFFLITKENVFFLSWVNPFKGIES